MLISHNWLKKYLPDLDEKIEKGRLSELLTESLAEVEQIIPIRQELDQIVCAEIVEVDKVPESTKLSICKVKTSEESPLRTVVCGAPNVKPGIKVALALPGGKVFDGHNQNKTTITIEQKELMNITSEGMLCSARELGLSNEHEGIFILEQEMPIGKDLTVILKDFVYEIENKSLSHRPDCFSHEGIAREISAIFSLDFIDTFQDIPLIPTKQVPFELKVKVENDICPRFNAICISDIKIEPSPLWLQSFLSAVGVRPIYNVVDIANYVMFDKGQPIHTYDYNKITGEKLIVKYAKNNEKAMFLNEKEYTLDESMMVISNAKTTENVAGIIGGSNSEITKETKNIIIEAANFNMYSIRKTSKKLGLRTESSTRYEKGLDPSITIIGLKSVVGLISDLAQGEISSDLVDYYPEPRTEKTVELDLIQVKRFLGIELTTRDILDYLKRLHFKIEDEEKISALTKIPDSNIIIKVVVPTFRADINIANDLLEEIARLYGYSKFSPSLPNRELIATKLNVGMKFTRKATHLLASLGFNEILTYSFVGEKLYNSLSMEVKNCLALKNPISPELGYLRNSLIPNLIDKCIQNTNKYNTINIFELGRVVYKELDEDKLHIQPNNLAILTYSNIADSMLFNKVKGVLEKLISELVIDNVEVEEYNEKELQIFNNLVHKGRTGLIKLSGETIGIIGEVSPEVMMNNLYLNGRIGFIELNVSKILPESKYIKFFKQLSVFQGSYRDLTLSMPDNAKYAQVIETIRALNVKEISSIEYLDLFQNKNDPKSKKNLTIRINLQSFEKTLSDIEITTIMNQVIDSLNSKLQVTVNQ